MSTPPRYVPLRVHSHFSLLGGVGAPEEILARAAELELPALAATESEGLYGVLAWARAARSSPVRVILGVELALPSPRRDGSYGRAIFLARGLAGYRALCRLVSAHRLRRAAASFGEANEALPSAVPSTHDLPPEDLPASDLSELFVLVDDVHLLARWKRVVPRGQLFAALGRGIRKQRGTKATRGREALDPDPRKAPDPAPPRDLEELLTAARELELPTVVAEDVWYPRPQDAAVHRRLLAIKHGALETQIETQASDAWLRSAIEMNARWSEHRDALERSVEIADACRLELPLGTVHFPRCPLPAGESAFSKLWALAQEGARQRYRPPTPEVARRLEYELRVIHELGFADYFLLVKQIRDFAAESDIPCIGRGSAADSLVAYVLRLTEADPLRYALPFERFLNPARRDRPDIDLDFCWRRRDEVLHWVYTRFGTECTAMICTQNTFGLRSAFRETAKVMGLPPHEVDRWSRALPYGFSGEASEFDGTAASGGDAILRAPYAEDSNAARVWSEGVPGNVRAGGVLAAALATPECRDLPLHIEPWRSVLLTADRLLGTPRHLGLHPGGVVVAPGPITDFCAVERAAKGVIVTQLDKDDVEELGLVKMDLLGNRGLSTLREARALIALRPGASPLPTSDAVPEDDPHAGGLLAAGDTLGCFQIESPAMRTLLKQLGAANMDRVIQTVALIRPGPAQSGMKDAFVRRCQGLEEISYAHPKLAEVLQETFGVMLYQEDVLFVARAIAGLSLSEADEVRRAMKRWREPHAMADLEVRFLAGAAKNDVDPLSAQRIWRTVQNFGNFSFCKAHAVTYGRMAYEAAWLKAHHPLEFLCAFLNSDTGYYERRIYIEDLRRRGFAILPPDLHRSGREFRVEYARERSVLPSTLRVPARGALRVGWNAIRGLRESTLEALITAREEGPLFNLRDLLERVPLDRREAETLILCGALDGFERTRPEMLWRLRLLLGTTPRRSMEERRATPDAKADKAQRVRLRAGWDQSAGAELFPAQQVREPLLPSLPEFDAERRTKLELELLGFSTAHHPLDFFQDLIDAAAPLPCAEVAAHRGCRITVIGWLVTTRRARTSRGEWMRFLSLEDRSGVVETVLFPQVYRRYGNRLRGLGPYIVRGIVDGGTDGDLQEVDEHGLPRTHAASRSTACTLRVEYLELHEAD